MTSSVERALQIPEVLENVAYWIPLFEYAFQTSWTKSHEEALRTYRPRYLLACTLVSRLWNTCFTPYLYHYCSYDRFMTNTFAFERNCHHFRRLLRWAAAGHEPFILPKNLVGLVPTVNYRIGNLLLYNQGSQLRELLWTGYEGGIDVRCMDALMNLPRLEELTLRHWKMSNEQLYGILKNCSGTLRELKLDGLGMIDEDQFNFVNNALDPSNDSPSGMTSMSLPHLKSLSLSSLETQSIGASRLLRCCPALETIDISFSVAPHSISNFASELREHCHNLQTIHLKTYFYMADTPENPISEMEALLFKDSIGPLGLKRAMVSVSRTVDNLMRDTLLFHADTLVTLRIERPHYLRSRTMGHLSDDLRNVLRLLELCRNLKEVELLDHRCNALHVPELLTSPWGCQGLEHLVINFWPSTTVYSDVPPELQPLESKRKRIREEAWPRRLRHHEYRDDGQGWFLKPGLSRTEFMEALVDGDLKRSLFEHMYNKGGIQKAKYIRLMDTEFFAREQHFDDMETERNEMAEDEGLVVDYREMPPMPPPMLHRVSTLRRLWYSTRTFLRRARRSLSGP
ncbi:hypothetical protein B0O80DRAFT_502450 [Mortierella sp. GBAus27b]|nr:hypothetical protein B0O80DRAFT_502450 [Mortierella sp. GBAus27b]